MREAELQEHLRVLSEALGWLYYHTWRSVHSAAGYPDTTLVRGHRLAFAELKREGEQPTEAQETWLSGLRKASVEVYVWRPTDLLDGTIRRVLEGDAP
jgi:hypothetical protein